VSSLRATNLQTGEVSDLAHDEVSEHLRKWMKSEFESRSTERPKFHPPVARPMTEAEWQEYDRIRDIRFYRYQDELNETEPIEIDEDDGWLDEECEDEE